jgi:hypothetical protein
VPRLPLHIVGRAGVGGEAFLYRTFEVHGIS